MLKVKPYRQKAGLCGVASLKMVLEYFGVKVGERKLIKMTGANAKKGMPSEGLKRTAKTLGFSFKLKDNASFGDIKRYLSKGIPPMVDWFSMFNDYSDGHFSVVVKLDKNYIYIQDPEIAGLRQMKLADFKRVWFDFEGDFMKANRDLILRRLIVLQPK